MLLHYFFHPKFIRLTEISGVFCIFQKFQKINALRIFKIFFLLVFSIFAHPVWSQEVLKIAIDGAIHPPSAEFIRKSIQQAEEKRAEALIIQLNTPGGLLKSTRTIVGDILEAKVPIVVYVSPSGAHAGSAGVFITMAAHIAAMAPGTNIGAAHPVGMQGGITDTVMNEKTTNDAAAFIRAIAQKRNRNLNWAEEAVRKSVSISETEAVEKSVVDLIAPDINTLLDSIHGRQLITGSGPVTLNTARAKVSTVEMNFLEKLLDRLSDPNIAYILMMLGFYGILFELYNPGSMVPGIVGVISIILAFYAMHTLPVNIAGIALIIFAIILFLLEIKITSYGMLTIGGVISLFLGSVMLFRTTSELEIIQISLSVIIPAVILSALFFLFVIGIGLKAQKARPYTGLDSLVGVTGKALTDLNPEGSVTVHGEIWNAKSSGGKILAGSPVKVTAQNGLTLMVEEIMES